MPRVHPLSNHHVFGVDIDKGYVFCSTTSLLLYEGWICITKFQHNIEKPEASPYVHWLSSMTYIGTKTLPEWMLILWELTAEKASTYFELTTRKPRNYVGYNTVAYRTFPEKSWRCYRTTGGLDDYLNLTVKERLGRSQTPTVVADGWYPAMMHFSTDRTITIQKIASYRMTMSKRSWEYWSFWWENIYADHYFEEMELDLVEVFEDV